MAEYPYAAESKGFLASLSDLSFSRFVTPSIIRVLYILALVVIGLIYLALLIAGLRAGVLPFLGALVFGGIGVLIEVLLVRLWLELVVVLFRIEEHTAVIAKK